MTMAATCSVSNAYAVDSIRYENYTETAYSESGMLALQADSSIVFKNNRIEQEGFGTVAVSAIRTDELILQSPGSIVFEGNSVALQYTPDEEWYSEYFGATTIEAASVNVKNTGSVAFADNTVAITNVGAVNVDDLLPDCHVQGALINHWSYNHPSLRMENNGQINIEGNGIVLDCAAPALTSEGWTYVSVEGGVMKGTASFENNDHTVIQGNYVSLDLSVEKFNIEQSYIQGAAYGGAFSGDIRFAGSGDIEFSDNKVQARSEWAFSSEYYHTGISGAACGGAVHGQELEFFGDGENNLRFCDNEVAHTSSMDYVGGNSFGANGGAISVLGSNWGVSSSLVIADYSSVVFSGNKALNADFQTAAGGAIYGAEHSVITITQNDEVIFEDNYAGNVAGAGNASGVGGAICGDTVSVLSNGSVLFSSNVATYRGNAILAGTLHIQNNDSVIFSGNGNGYSYSCIDANNAIFSAAGSKKIELRESLSISNLEVGTGYTDSRGVLLAQNGDVIFTGAYIEDVGIRSEQDLSRTFDVESLTLNGGSLRVEERAILTGKVFNAVADSHATLSITNAFINEAEGEYTFASGTTFSLEGKNEATLSSLTMQSGSSFDITLSDINARRAALSINGSLIMQSGVTFNLSFAEGATVYQKNALITIVDGAIDELGWSLNDVSFVAPVGYEIGTSSLYWEGNTLYVDFKTLPAYQVQVVHADSSNDITDVSSLEGDYVFRVQQDIDITVVDSPIMNQKSTWSVVADAADNPVSLSLSSESSRIFDVGCQEQLTVEGLSSFSLCGSDIEVDDTIVGLLMYVEEGAVVLKNNGVVSVSNNVVTGCAVNRVEGLIHLQDSSFTAEDNTLVEIKGNRIYASYGGYTFNNGGVFNGIVTLQGNDKVEIAGNKRGGTGIVQYGGVSHGVLNCIGNIEVNVSGNLLHNNYGDWSDVSDKNSDTYGVGGVHSGESLFRGNKQIVFSSNGVCNLIRANGNIDTQDYGGALFCAASKDASHQFYENGSIAFQGNHVTVGIDSHDSSSHHRIWAGGGAIQGSFLFERNDSVEFNNNYVNGFFYQIQDDASTRYGEARGGAIYAYDTLSLNANGKVVFANNHAQLGFVWHNPESQATATGGFVSGGAICARTLLSGDLSITNNAEVTFVNNYVAGSGDVSSVIGGAIYSEIDVSIQNNGTVLFSKNYEEKNGVYQLRSIVLSRAEAPDLVLSAAAEKSITFEDSIGYGVAYPEYETEIHENEVHINSLFEDGEGEKYAQTGDIVFTAAYTEEHLKEIKNGVAGTAEEVLNSRSSEVWGSTHVHDGRLRIEDGAIYKGHGLTAHSSVSGQSSPTVRVKDAELSHVGYELEFNAGTTLEVAGESTIRGQVNLKEGSVFKLELGAVLGLHETEGDDAASLSVSGTAMLIGTSTLNASLTLMDGATLDMDNLDAGAVTLNGALTFGGQVAIGENLLALLEDIKGQAEGMALFTGIDSLTLPQAATTSAASDRVWADSVFSNLSGNQSYSLVYKADTGTLSIVYIPEPATATLSLLALAGLAARRRRK